MYRCETIFWFLILSNSHSEYITCNYWSVKQRKWHTYYNSQINITLIFPKRLIQIKSFICKHNQIMVALPDRPGACPRSTPVRVFCWRRRVLPTSRFSFYGRDKSSQCQLITAVCKFNPCFAQQMQTTSVTAMSD